MGKSGGSTVSPFGSDDYQGGGGVNEGYAPMANPKQNWGTDVTKKYTGATDLDASNNFVARQYGFDKQAWEQTQDANRPNINSAYGGQQWSQGPDGQWTLSNGFNGALGGANQSLQENYANSLRKPLDGNAARDEAITASYGQATSRLDPQWDKRQEAQRTQLLNQGLDPTSEAGKSAMSELGLQRNDAYNSAMNSAIMQGNQAGNDVFRNNLSGQQSYVDQMNKMNQLLDTPKYNVAGQAPTAQWLQALRDKNNIAIGEQARSDQQTADTTQGAMTAMSALALAASDERLKTKIVRLAAEALPGVPWATWEWKDAPGRRCFGVIAQDVEKVAPQFVLEGPDGFKLVDYGFVKGGAGGHLETQP